MTLATFLARFPEFGVPGEPVTSSLIEAKLAEAGRRVSADVFGDFSDDAVGYLTAHLLSQSPFGQQARLDSDGRSTYEQRYLELVHLAAAGPLTT